MDEIITCRGPVLYGMEIEAMFIDQTVECTLPRFTYWANCHDTSIEGYGREFKTTKGLTRGEMILALKELLPWLQGNMKSDISCGIHIHRDGTDLCHLEEYQIKHLNYMVLDGCPKETNRLFKSAGNPERRDSIFCCDTYNNSRFCAVNIAAALYQHGTVEYRIFSTDLAFGKNPLKKLMARIDTVERHYQSVVLAQLPIVEALPIEEVLVLPDVPEVIEIPERMFAVNSKGEALYEHRIFVEIPYSLEAVNSFYAIYQKHRNAFGLRWSFRRHGNSDTTHVVYNRSELHNERFAEMLAEQFQRVCSNPIDVGISIRYEV